MSTYGDEVAAIDVALTTESAPQELCHLRRSRNFLASQLLHLPTELILTIIEYAIQPDDRNDCPEEDEEDDETTDDDTSLPPPEDSQLLLALTAACHRLRQIAMTPHLWGYVDLAIHPLAKFSLELCNFDPHTIAITWSDDRCFPEWELGVSKASAETRDLLSQLEARSLENLRCLVFSGELSTFAESAAPLLQRARNVTNLELHYPYTFRTNLELPLFHGAISMPNLSALRLHRFTISWASPLLRNLRQLYLEAQPFSTPSMRGSVKMFLAALAGCPDLEELTLDGAGPDLTTWHQEDQDVVQLRRLRKLRLRFRDPFVIGCILSHIEYGRSVDLQVEIRVDEEIDLAELIPPTLLHQKIQAIQCSRKSRLSVELSNRPAFSTEIFHFRFLRGYAPMECRDDPRAWLRLAPGITEAVWRNTISSFAIRLPYVDLAEGILKGFLYGLPQLERIDYYPLGVWGDRDSIDPFLSVFSQPFEGGPVCPRLRELRLSWGVLTLFSSVMVLRHAMEERDVRGMRLRRIGFIKDWGDEFLLEPFRNFVDEILPPRFFLGGLR